ncbi:MAG TPA: hypothetical protein PLQ82_15260 [Desulfobacteraceae bacterium]|nr:hypothetical protein [Bacteroidales bacterium]HPQ29830.1 hypothetical protein [Desulfobacteraceae bacterium]HRW94520.1 hypothetical protein [Bacteroidales bacterium]
MNKMYHVFSEGENVLFRENSDYIFFNNKFASSTYTYQLQDLAETTMSSHFHSLVETADEKAVDDVIFKLRKAYALYYSSKYGYSIGDSFRISKLEISGRESILKELIYIMKNPVHHYVTVYPLSYPFSSVAYIFIDSLMPPVFIDALNARTSKICELSFRQKKRLIGLDEVPDNWLVLDNNMILPSSYINTVRIRAFWNNNVKSFMYDINKNLTDARKEIISADNLDIRASGFSDIDVCRIIDDFSAQAGRKSFHFLNTHERNSIIRILKQKAVIEEQIRRCLWL